jgi:hypothetical protein
MPTLKGGDSHSITDLEIIEDLLDDVEKAWEIVFPQPKPGSPFAQVVNLFPDSQIISHDNEPKDSA